MYAQLLQENRLLKKTVEELVDEVEELKDIVEELVEVQQGKGKMKDKWHKKEHKKRIQKPQFPKQAEIKPPWKRDGLSKKEWIKRKHEKKHD